MYFEQPPPLGSPDSLPGSPPLAIHGIPARIRVLLVDDHAMMRQGLRSVLEAYSDVQIVGEAQDGEEAIALVHQFQPAVVIMDINMPKLNGIEATVQIKSDYPQIKVIGLSVNAERENQDAMIEAGAYLLITKEAAVDELYRAIEDAVARKQ
jgi:DNA-binding NarL/FixJ family response regulator